MKLKGRNPLKEDLKEKESLVGYAFEVSLEPAETKAEVEENSEE